MLSVGITNKQSVWVDETNTALAMGSGSVEVFATPAMINLIESTCAKSIEDELEAGMTSVGTALSIEHVAATPLEMEVTCISILEKVDGRRLVFRVEVSDEVEIIGRGTHERFIVRAEKFHAKARLKKSGGDRS